MKVYSFIVYHKDGFITKVWAPNWGVAEVTARNVHDCPVHKVVKESSEPKELSEILL